MPSVRWAFNISKWEPSEKEFLFASSCMQSEEKSRIDKFVYRKDVKASLAGRLMIRKFVTEQTKIPYQSIKLLRDSNNKPIYYTEDPGISAVSFNISHHGSYTVLAGEIGNKKVGVDVMKLEYSGGRTVEEFFRLMSRNFSTLEWEQIEGYSRISRQIQIANFCRNWALKESYSKAIGKGLTMDLEKLNFHINSKLDKEKITLDTRLYINNEKQAWIFEESLLDQFHCVVVALEEENYIAQCGYNSIHFSNLTSSELLENAIPLLPHDFEYCKRYFLKNES